MTSKETEYEDLSNKPHEHIELVIQVDYIVPDGFNEEQIITQGIGQFMHIISGNEVNEEDLHSVKINIKSREKCDGEEDSDEPEITLDNIISLASKRKKA